MWSPKIFFYIGLLQTSKSMSLYVRDFLLMLSLFSSKSSWAIEKKHDPTGLPSSHKHIPERPMELYLTSHSATVVLGLRHYQHSNILHVTSVSSMCDPQIWEEQDIIVRCAVQMNLPYQSIVQTSGAGGCGNDERKYQKKKKQTVRLRGKDSGRGLIKVRFKRWKEWRERMLNI